MIRTWEFGTIRIVDSKEITLFDRYIREDILGEFSYYQMTNGEIVAVEN